MDFTLTQSFTSLSDLERAAIAARFGLHGGAPMTMAELGSSLGLSRERTRAILSAGLDKLRVALSDTPG